MNIRLLCLLGALALTNTDALADQEPASGVAAAERGNIKLIADTLHRHTAILASDAFGGRAPATDGEALTTAYLVKQFRALGLAPGNGDSYLQRVPVTELSIDAGATLAMKGKNFSTQLEYGDEMVVSTEKQVEATALEDSKMVFVGYGIVAQERNWNDYAGVDVRGKTVVILVNDPGYATQDESLFNGNAMTWYGRWPYKYEEAARQGAAGALIVHETGAAAYGWQVVYNSWSRPQISLTAKDRNAGKSEVIGWLSQESARTLFAGAGLDYDAEVAAAARPGFRARPLGDIRASISLSNTIRTSESDNVVAIIPGIDRPGEAIVYSAHWDHLGINPKVEGDNIYNGAKDNATGIAGLLALARLFSELPEVPPRTVVFLAVTAEESGLLGSQWYGENPLFPHATTVANINMDGLNVYGPMRDVVVVGYGNSELEDYLRTAVAEQPGRYVTREPHPERGSYYRSDHFNFARHGVPALYAKSGEDSFAHGREWGAKQAQDYTDQLYHSPQDEYNPDWDLSGAALDIMLYFEIGRRLSGESTYPNWYPGNEFRDIRDASASSRR